MSYNEKIRKRRLELNLSQDNVAAEMGVATSAYGRYEKAGTNLSIKSLQKIAKALKVDISYFFNQTKTSEPDENTSVVNENQELFKLFAPAINDGYNFYKSLYETQQKEIEGYKDRIKMLENKVDAKDIELDKLRAIIYKKESVK